MLQNQLSSMIDAARINQVGSSIELKLLPNDLRIVRTNWLRRIEIGIRLCGCRIVDIHTAVGEIPIDLGRGGYGVNHRVRHGMAETFIIHEEKCVTMRDGSTERCAEIVLHQMIVAHRFE